MKGELTEEQQVRVLSRIWGRRTGYVFLPWISGLADTVQKRRMSYHEGRAYKWPQEREAILSHIKARADDDLYFTPALFNGKRRIEQNTDAEQALWADLDPVDPRSIEFRPTIAWETSPGRYQGVWLLNVPKIGASWPSKENHRLSMYLGADPSGWDSTQLLRVPGRRNHKPDYKGNSTGKLLWENGPRYVWSDFDQLPEVGSATPDIDLVDEDLITGVDRHEVWARVRLRVSSRCREFMALKTEPDKGSRSEILWEIERELADAGCSLVEIIALIRPSVWNKYAGRDDELKRLKIEAAKAIASRGTGGGEALEEESPKPTVQWLSSLAAQPIPRPRWLVKDIWTRGGCGFIAGAPKSYKSWTAIDLAVSVATGRPFLNQPQFHARMAAPVLYLQEEDNLHLVMQRIAAVFEGKAPELHWHGQLAVAGTDGSTSDDIHTPAHDVQSAQGGPQRPVPVLHWSPPVDDVRLAVHVQAGFIASDPGWQAWLADVVAEHKFALVVIDTLGTTAGEVDTDRAQDLMTKVLRPLKTIATTYDCAICVVHHNRKGDGAGRAGQQMLGSVALHAWVDAALYARTKDADGTVVLERESKQSTDLQLRVQIPHMSDDHPVWMPELAEERVDQAEPTPAARNAGTAGKLLAGKVRMMGPGPHTLDHLCEVMGKNITDQAEAAVRNGYLVKNEEGKYSVPKA